MMHKKNLFIVASYNKLNSLTSTSEVFGNARPKFFCGFLYDLEIDSWFGTSDVLVENFLAVEYSFKVDLSLELVISSI